jgi:AbrB family looped-hinge helix DNA binding protein
MPKVTVSSKYQISLPREVRDALKIRPGQKIEMFVYKDRLELVPLKRLKEYRGRVRGIDTTIIRERDRL